MKPREAWALMPEEKARTMRSCLQLHDGSGLMALKGGPSGAGEIALCLPGGDVLTILRTSWRGLDMGEFRRVSDPETLYLTLGPQAPYRQVFGFLCDDLMDALEDAQSALEIQRLTAQHLSLWSGFLRPAGLAQDMRTLRGLYGELRFLEDVLVPAVGWPAALSSWEGPAGAVNDVRLDHLRIEIKTTSTDDQTAVISSVEQLDPPTGDELWVAQALMSPEEGPGSETLAAVLARLIHWARESACAGLLQARVAQTGVDVDVPALHTLVQWQWHHALSNSFPRLVRAELRPGIQQCSYHIDLASYPGIRPEPGSLKERLAQTVTEKTQ